MILYLTVVKLILIQKERGAIKFRQHQWKGEHRGKNTRFAPSIKLPEGLGEIYFPSLLGDGAQPQQAQASNDCQACMEHSKKRSINTSFDERYTFVICC